MNRLIYSLALLCALLLPQTSHAYDIDTHFYHTYSMARYAGIGHDVALYLATADQWADESELTSPLAIPKPGPGMLEYLRKERFIHFGCSLRADIDINLIEAIKIKMGSMFNMEVAKLQSLLTDLVCNVSGKGNDPFASQIEMLGLKGRDLLIAGAGLHTLQDSYAHAGYSNYVGHAAHGHWPDRPYDRPEFYKDMIHTFFKALVAIRTLLPQSALDTKNPHSRSGSQFLADKYVEIPQVKAAIYFSPLRDSEEYGQKVFNNALGAAIKSGVVQAEALKRENQIPNLLQIAHSQLGPADELPNKMLQIWAITMIQNAMQGKPTFINLKKARAMLAPGRPPGAISLEELTENAVLFFTANHIPIRPTAIADAANGKPNYHPVELEEEGANSAYTLEMKIRVDEYKKLIADLYGVALDFGGDKGADGKSVFLQRMSQTDQTHWDDFFKNIIEKGIHNMVLDTIDRGIFHKQVTRGMPLLQAQDDVLYYQYPEAFNQMIREKKLGWLADDARIKQIKEQNIKAGYSEMQLSNSWEPSVYPN